MGNDGEFAILDAGKHVRRIDCQFSIPLVCSEKHLPSVHAWIQISWARSTSNEQGKLFAALAMTCKGLRSETSYAGALPANTQSFSETVTAKRKKEALKSRRKDHEQRFRSAGSQAQSLLEKNEGDDNGGKAGDEKRYGLTGKIGNEVLVEK